MLPKSLLSALLGACSFKPGKLQRHQKHNHLDIFLVRTVGVMTEKKKKMFLLFLESTGGENDTVVSLGV